MLRFSNANYMPKVEIEKAKKESSEQITASAEKALNILGRRLNAMYYFNSEVVSGNSNLVKVLMTDSELGIELATAISSVVSDVPYHNAMRTVMLHDVTSPEAIPGVSLEIVENGNFFITASSRPYLLLQDERFLVAVNNKERYLEVFIYEKQTIAA